MNDNTKATWEYDNWRPTPFSDYTISYISYPYVPILGIWGALTQRYVTLQAQHTTKMTIILMFIEYSDQSDHIYCWEIKATKTSGNPLRTYVQKFIYESTKKGFLREH